jgi:hypothetical protein
MDDLAILIRGIGKIAAALRERADTVKWANASHLHAIADSIDHEINSVEPRRRKWRDAPIASETGRAALAAAGPTLGDVLAGTYSGVPVFMNGPGRDARDPIRAVFRQCGMFEAAANDRLCLDLYLAVTKRSVVVPIVNQKVLDEASEVATQTGFAMTDGVRVLTKEDVMVIGVDYGTDSTASNQEVK